MNENETTRDNAGDHGEWRDRFSESGEARGAEAAEQDQARGAEAVEQDETRRDAERAADCKDCGGEPCMPKPTFSTFVLSLASSALVQLGEVPDPSSGQVREDLVLAKHSIDILSMLQDKIKNGLDGDEDRLLDGLLYELRMKFVMKK